MEDWLARKFGEGRPVKLRLTELKAENRTEDPELQETPHAANH